MNFFQKLIRLGIFLSDHAVQFSYRSSGLLLKFTDYRGVTLAAKLFANFSRSRRIRIYIYDATLEFDSDDIYWNRLLVRGYKYEPEIENVLIKIRGLEYTFIDAGANIGYWSMLVSGETFGRKNCVSIEAAGDTYLKLLRNNELNQCRVKTLQYAVWSTSGLTLSLRPGAHEARGVGDGEEKVQSLSLDELIAATAPKGPTVVKLDVEGAEIEILSSSRSFLNSDVLLIYEDHGSDPSHAVSRFVLQLGYKIHFLQATNITPIEKISQIDHLKHHSGTGYNFIAYSPSSNWNIRLGLERE